MKKIKVIELFAGVGGFRIGLEGWQGQSASSRYTKELNSPYEIVWSNQWEPATKAQYASLVYENRFGTTNHCNEDITAVEISKIPDHDLLVGGFPCQDYSVATTLKNSKGLLGKKGVLWWSIHRILSEKKKKTKYLFLENVDRLLISPSGQRGRDFAIILQSLNELGYAVEWRVVNAAEFGMPQRRRRIFIMAYLAGTKIYRRMKSAPATDWILTDGILAQALPVIAKDSMFSTEFKLADDIVSLSENFNKDENSSVFENTGMMIDGVITTLKTQAQYKGEYVVLKDLILNEGVCDDFYIAEHELEKWRYLKGAKKELRVNLQGFEYNYSEGGMTFPDALDKPSRTIITGEGGKSASRFKHVINTSKGYRRLSPIELERLNMFPDNHTQLDGVSDIKRAFFMGNALVVGVVEKIGIYLQKGIEE
jgi:DNA (cytosine-5)-methyltransferase 1